MKRLLTLLVIFALGFIVLFQSLPGKEEHTKEEHATVGFKAPEFTLSALDGKSYSLEKLRGKPVVVNFWASWCSPCKDEAPELVRLYKKFGNQIEIFAVNLAKIDSLPEATAFSEKYNLPFPVLLDEKAEASRKYRLRATPTTYFISKNGIIADMLIGQADPDKLEKKFAQLVE
ncbi:TlpA family protein disulfide reductase [Paenibacillus puerhi]|uniref:TlpA family protein disulfide reductase n=1 Tax=Paenibacillus puerhi TaxID=2692622 RepID=UPI00135C93FF|nr:TlpA disulfide reductase family protein [Paenibacillus puerhi]